MEEYYVGAKELAALFNECHAVSTLPLEPVSNMFHVHISTPKESLESVLIEIYKETDIGITGRLKEGDHTCSFEVSIGDQYTNIPSSKVKEVFLMLDQKLKQINCY